MSARARSDGSRRPWRRLLSGLLAASSVAALLVVGPAGRTTANATTGVKAAGVVTDLTWYISRAEMDRSIALMRDAGVRWVRANVNWSSVEPNSKGSIDQWWLDELDYAVRSAQSAGIQVLMPIADGVPYWASADPQKYQDASGKHWNRYWKPTSFQDYADFVRVVVSRYKSLGVHTYEVWNEPNYVRFWPSGPSATDYTAMLRAASPVIKQADPSATVVLGGLSLSDSTYLQQLYAAGAGPYFDVAAVHPYTGSVDPTLCWNEPGTARLAKEAFCGIEEVRKTMLANGDSSNIWLTEFGWSTAPVPNGVDEATQASYLSKAFERIAGYPYVTNAFWYSFRNNYWQANDQTDLEANYGLTKVDFTQKPAYTAFRTYASSLPPVTTAPGPAPDDRAPTITNVAAGDVTTTAAAVSWTTDEPATSTVTYWVSGSSTRASLSQPGMHTSHRVVLPGLLRRTRYSFTVHSVDAAGNAAVSPASSFTTRK